MMDHNSIRHKLSEYIDGTISPDERSLVEEHLKTCEKCSDALHELQKTVEHIKTVEEIEPPAWMTQKIMAKVRGEAEQRKSFSERLYSVFIVNLPVKAVAVVFLTAIAFTMYRGILPQKLSETTPTSEIAARQEASPAPAAKDERSKLGASSPRAKQVPQSPEYKALDMKGEYEKPAPPALADKMAPAPEKQDELPRLAKKEPAMERRAFAPQASAPAIAENQAARAEKKSAAAPFMGLDEGTPSTGLMAREVSKQKSFTSGLTAPKAAAAQGGGPTIFLSVKDIEVAARDVELAIAQLGGSITRKKTPESKKIYTVSINTHKLQDLKARLKRIGEVKDETGAPASQDSRVEIKIEIMMKIAQP